MDDKTTNSNGKTVLCNLYNPTRGRRVIYDGIEETMRAITVDGGATKYSVMLSRSIAEELRDRNRIKKDSDLVIQPATAQPAPPPPPELVKPAIS